MLQKVEGASPPEGGARPSERTERSGKIKLITVHGTGAGDTTATGDRWWQLGSAFNRELCARLELDSDQVEIVPFQWHDHQGSKSWRSWLDWRTWLSRMRLLKPVERWPEGPNKESERRASAKQLLRLLKGYEAEGIDYHLIGHSHGGSVIYNALLEAVETRISLDRLQMWCTVGTPFLDYRANRWLFQRLGGMGMTFYLTGLVALMLAASILIAIYYQSFTSGDRKMLGDFAVALLMYATGCYVLLRFLEKRRNSWFDAGQKREVEARYGAKWLGLWHQEDEAISALYNIKGVSGQIIPTTFLQPIVAGTQLAVVLILGLLFAVINQFDGTLMKEIADEITLDDQGNINHDFGILGFFWVNSSFFLNAFLIVGITTWILKRLAWLVGIPLSSQLNKIIWSSVRQRAWGDDLLKEDVASVSAFPPEFKRQYVCLPEMIAGPLRAHSDGHAISTLNKVRLILGMAGDQPSGPDLKAELSESLKWKELIHTSYFDVPEFVDLLALGMQRGGLGSLKEGFKLGGDDLDHLREWLKAGSAADIKVAAE